MSRAATASSAHAAIARLETLAGELQRKYATPPAATATAGTVATGRLLNVSAGILALSVLADSGVEHYRGSFQNRAMMMPLGVGALTLAASLGGLADARPRPHPLRDGVYAAAAATGAAGLAFHTYNIAKRPGGFSWLNLFYAAPVGAPVALVLAGLLGRSAERVRDARRPTVFGVAAAPALTAVTCAGILGTVGEAGLMHFRGAFHNPAMALPVTVPPAGAALLAASLLSRRRWLRGLTRIWLMATAALGGAGVGFHAYGVSRNMGGWYNWSQNVLNGPPLPAPPSFTGLALAGIAALRLIEERDDG